MSSTGLPEQEKTPVKHGPTPETETFREKSLAVVSGKGGVGKTTTAVNLAIHAARSGLRTGLLDLDPLSDIATLLDIVQPESAVRTAAGQRENGMPGTVPGLQELTVPVFRNLDLLFPSQKTSRASVEELYRMIRDTHSKEIAGKYDLVIFDMPAGSDPEETLRYLPLVRSILLVTNPEPTAHVAAGHFLKKTFETLPDARVLVWHNRFSANPGTGFDPRDLIGNYNRNVAEEDRIPPGFRSRVTDVAFVPHDQSLDLLKGKIDPLLLLQRNMLTLLRSMLETSTQESVEKLAFSGRVREILTYYISRKDTGADPEKALEGLGTYLLGLFHSDFTRGPSEPGGTREPGAAGAVHVSPFTETERGVLLDFFRNTGKDRLRSLLVREIRVLEHQMKTHAEANSLFSSGIRPAESKLLDRSVPELLMQMNGTSLSPAMKNLGGLLLFYFALYKLCQSETVTDLIRNFLPVRTNAKGRTVRDRNRQIRSIVEGSSEYRQRFFQLVKTMYPIVMKQVSTVLSTFSVRSLAFHGDEGAAGRAYLKLLSGFLHDAVNSGLGVIVGFEYRPAAAGFKQGAERLLSVFGLNRGTEGPEKTPV